MPHSHGLSPRTAESSSYNSSQRASHLGTISELHPHTRVPSQRSTIVPSHRSTLVPSHRPTRWTNGNAPHVCTTTCVRHRDAVAHSGLGQMTAVAVASKQLNREAVSTLNRHARIGTEGPCPKIHPTHYKCLSIVCTIHGKQCG